MVNNVEGGLLRGCLSTRAGATVYPGGLRIAVWGVLSWLAGGMTEQEILEDYPELQSEDFRAFYEFAARMGKRIAL